MNGNDKGRETVAEHELKRQELEDNRQFRKRSLQLQSRDLILKAITNPLLVATITIVGGVYGHTLLERSRTAELQLAQKRFCYDVARDLIIEQPERRQEAAADLERLVETKLIGDCQGDLREVADFYSKTPAPPIEPPATATSTATCERFEPIRNLGWSSGHKTRFCIASGFDGVHNPFGDYSAGGYCFKGDSQACIARIQAETRR